MERESNQMQPMCRSGCGFFGNPATEGLCSKCFKESLKKKQQPSPTTTSTASANYQGSGNNPSSPYLSSSPVASTPVLGLPQRIPLMGSGDFLHEGRERSIGLLEVPSGAALASALADQVPGPALPLETPKKKRCLTCRKKLGLTGFECRCGGLYCATHRYSDKHECSFNYRELGAEEIRRNNPVVVGEKIKKF